MKNPIKFIPKQKVSEPSKGVAPASPSTGYVYGKWIRSTVTDDDYWLNSLQLDEFDDMSLAIEDDKKFNDWFEDFVVKEKCQKRYKGAWTPRAAPVDWGGSKWSTGEGSLSSWWRSDLYGKWAPSWGNDDERTLAKAMQVIQSTIRIVDDSVPPMTCAWAEQAMSYTDLSKNEIHINPAPVTKQKEKKLSFEEAVDICTGLGLHEAGHANGEYGTRSVNNQLLLPKPMEPMGIVGMLANIIEDIRTERETGKEFPGFVAYLRKVHDFTWGERSAEHNPTEWKTIPDAMNALIIHLKWPEHSDALLSHQSFKDELPWWDEWNDKYQTGKVNLRDSIQAALDRLALDEERKKEMEAMANQERIEGVAKSVGAAVARAMQDEWGKQVIAETCANHVDEDDKLDDETAQKARQYVNEKLHEEEVRIPEKGKRKPKIWVRRPSEDGQSKAAYIGKPGNIVERLKAALQFRPELARYFTRLQKSGQIDEDELWRWGDNDYRVFQQQNVEVYPKAHVALLVDMSGSMCSIVKSGEHHEEKVLTAQRLAQLLILALRDMEGVTPYVYGHTGDLAYSDSSGSADFMYIWEPGDPLSRLGLISSSDHGNNYDGYAINWVVDKVLERSRPEDQKLLIVLSDGYPAGSNYGYGEAMDHVREVTDDAEKKEVYVIQVAIDNSIRPHDQGRMFKHWVQYEGADKLPQQLARVVSKVLNTVAAY